MESDKTGLSQVKTLRPIEDFCGSYIGYEMVESVQVVESIRIVCIETSWRATSRRGVPLATVPNPTLRVGSGVLGGLSPALISGQKDQTSDSRQSGGEREPKNLLFASQSDRATLTLQVFTDAVFV